MVAVRNPTSAGRILDDTFDIFSLSVPHRVILLVNSFGTDRVRIKILLFLVELSRFCTNIGRILQITCKYNPPY